MPAAVERLGAQPCGARRRVYCLAVSSTRRALTSPPSRAWRHSARTSCTRVEKRLRINNFASDAAARQTAHGWVRIGRQFYDVWALLGTPEVLDFLADKASAASVLADCYRASRAFKPDMPVPDGGFPRSVAFDPEGELAAELRTRHDQAMAGLYYGTDRPPSFDDVVARVARNESPLDIS